MGVDIDCFAERQDADGAYHRLDISVFDWRSYALFGFLAGVRNYSAVEPISQPRGVPADMSEGVRQECELASHWGYSFSWLSLQELLLFNYDQQIEDRRCTVDGDGGRTCEPGVGQKMALREFLGPLFFSELTKLQAAGADRIVFWFGC